MKGPAQKVIVRASKRKGTASGVGKRESIGCSKIGDLPKNIRPLVSSAQNQLRLIVALKTAWSKETTVPSARLPSSDDLIVMAVREAVKNSKGINPMPLQLPRASSCCRMTRSTVTRSSTFCARKHTRW